MRQRWMILAVCLGAVPGEVGLVEAAPPQLKAASVESREARDGVAAAVKSLSRERRDPFWIGWAVPAMDKARRVCCFDSLSEADDCCGRCSLEKRDSGMSMNIDDDDPVRLEATPEILVLARVSAGAVGRIRAYSPTCELDAGGRHFVWLTGVSSSSSLSWLAGFAGRDDEHEKKTKKEDLPEQALAAIALHLDPEADRILTSLASPGRPRETREQATFWIGNMRGETGLEALRKLLRGEEGSWMRKKIVFALSQNGSAGAIDEVLVLARRDEDPDVRGEALFWLAQAAGHKALAALKHAIDEDPETEVKKKAVFGLSQLPKEEGVPLLLDLARRHPNPAVRKEAIFWLGQSGDPRALEFFEEVLNG